MFRKSFSFFSFILIFLLLAVSSASARLTSPKGFQVLLEKEGEKGNRIIWDFKQEDPFPLKVQVERSQEDSDFEPLFEAPLVLGEVLDPLDNLMIETAYRYRIRIFSPDGETSRWIKSKEITFPKLPYKPIESFFLMQAQETPAIQVSWKDINPGNPQVIIERKDPLSHFTPVGSVNEDHGVFVNGGIEDESVYTYRLYVEGDADGLQSEYSKEKPITFYSELQDPVLSPECSLERKPEGDQVFISWDPQLEGRLIEIERKSNEGSFTPLAVVPERNGFYQDRKLKTSSEILEKSEGYSIFGNRYTYRLRYKGHNSIYPIDWQVLEPIDYGVSRYHAAEIKVERLPDKKAIRFFWEDSNINENPTILIERKVGNEDYAEHIRVLESKLQFIDFRIEKEKRYSYRFTWLGKGTFIDSKAIELNQLSFVPPVWDDPKGVETRAIQNDPNFSLVQISWRFKEEEKGIPTVEIQRSTNNRDFVTIGEALATDLAFRDAKVTHVGGTPRVVDGTESLINVYRYRLRHLDNGEIVDSGWVETKDVVILGPKAS